jgi:hypothetical protein
MQESDIKISSEKKRGLMAPEDLKNIDQCSPFAARYLSASNAAIHPVPAAVTA